MGLGWSILGGDVVTLSTIWTLDLSLTAQSVLLVPLGAQTRED